MIRLLRHLAHWLPSDLRREFGPDLDVALAESWRNETAGRGPLRRLRVGTALVGDLARQMLAARWPRSLGSDPLHPIPRGPRPMDNLRLDLRFALRSLRRSPLVTGIVLATLTLGIGGSTTVFTIVNAEMLAPLPYRDAGRLVMVYGTDESSGSAARNLSAPNLRDIGRQARSLESITGFDDRKTFNLMVGELPTRIYGASVDGAFFETLGVTPVHGRFIGATDDRPEAPLVAVLAEGLWRNEFAGDPDIVGATVRMNELSYTVIGIAPATLRIPDAERVWVPLASHPYGDERLSQRSSTILEAIARLAPNADMDAVRRELRDLGTNLVADFPEDNDGFGIGIRPLREVLVGGNRSLLTLLMGAVGAVLLLACVNVAALLVGRASERESEIALRVALGAGRGRVARQLITEALLTAALAGGAGVALAIWSRRAILSTMPGWFPRLEQVGLDARVLLFAALLTLGTGVLFGLLPALLASRAQPVGGLSLAGGHRGTRIRRALVVVEVAFALVLLVDAGLMVRSIVNLAMTDNGFLTDEVLSATVTLPESRYDAAASVEFVERLVGELQRRPGVLAAAAVNRLPVSGGTNIAEFTIADRGSDYEASAHLRLATAGYFDALGVEIVEGRAFTADEYDRRDLVAVVDAELAARHWPDGDAIGAEIHPNGAGAGFRVIGIAERTRHWGPEYGPEPVLYGAFSIAPTPTVMLAIRTDAAPLGLAPELRRIVHDLDAEIPLEQVRTLADAVAAQTARPRVGGVVLGLFAAYALGLAVLGVYGVLGSAVRQRTSEIGIRMAMGAQASGIRKLVVTDGARVIGAGVVLGLVFGVFAARAIASQLHGVEAFDPFTFLGVTLVLVVTGLVAAALPAERATRVDPVDCLRTE